VEYIEGILLVLFATDLRRMQRFAEMLCDLATLQMEVIEVSRLALDSYEFVLYYSGRAFLFFMDLVASVL
jgi:hypothetical protein